MSTIRATKTAWLILFLLSLMMLGCQVVPAAQPAPTPLPPATPLPPDTPVPPPTPAPTVIPRIGSVVVDIDYATVNMLPGTSDPLSKLVEHSTVIVIGRLSRDEPDSVRVQDRTNASVQSVGSSSNMQVERYLKGTGGETIPIVQFTGLDFFDRGQTRQVRDKNENLLLDEGSRYLLFLKENESYPGYWSGTIHPYKFLLEDGEARSESPVGTMGGKFPNRPESEFIDEIEALIAGEESRDTTETEATNIPDESQWLLLEVNGDALIGGTYATLEINRNSYGGYDGCNDFGGMWDDGTPIAGQDGTFSVPVTFRTLQLCEGTDGVMEQADAYTTALREGKTFRLDGDRLQILDEANDVRLVLLRKTPLPGGPFNLVGTSWRLVEDNDEGVGERSPTLAFLSDYIAAGVTACRAYVVHFRVDDERVRFPAMSMTGTTKGCAEQLLEQEGIYTDQLSLSDDYSVEKTAGGGLLRIRTKNGRVLMFEPLPDMTDGVTEGRWSLTTFIEPLEAKTGRMRHSRATDVIPETEVTIEFGGNGVSGSAGCNRYGAPINIAGEEVTVGAATVTRAWCDDPAGFMDQERLYLDILSRVKDFRIFGDQLAIQTDKGEQLLFQAK